MHVLTGLENLKELAMCELGYEAELVLSLEGIE